MAGDPLLKDEPSTKEIESNDKNENETTIKEGSAIMKFPADEETAVFYNPVQVKNRDLSVLMISLYTERLAIRKEMKKERKKLRENKISGEDLKEQLQQYEKTLGGMKLVAENEEYRVSVLDALAASGLRSIRYWKEIPGVGHVTINDLEQSAVDRAFDNLDVNELKHVVISEDKEDKQEINNNDNKCQHQRPHGIAVQLGDATSVMYQSRRPQQLYQNHQIPQAKEKEQPRWDVIDLDPYGSAAPFLDAAVQAVESGGLINVTCTDMAALGGSHPETCYGRYSSFPIPNAKYLQEVAVRILLKEIATTAAKYGRTMRPILSVGMDFYVRVFVEIHDSKAEVMAISLKIGNVYQSTQCPSFHTVPHCQMGGKSGRVYQPARAPAVPSCEETGAPFKVGGPLWLGPMHDLDVIKAAIDRLESKDSEIIKSLATRTQLLGLLTTVSEELPDVPLYFTVPSLSRTLACQSPPLNQVKAALINAGYRVSGYHKEPQALKTDAPNKVLWDVLRTWIRQNPNKKKPQEGSAAEKILATEPTIDVDFTIPKSLKNMKKDFCRFPMNPQPNWGPKPKANSTKRKSKEISK